MSRSVAAGDSPIGADGHPSPFDRHQQEVAFARTSVSVCAASKPPGVRRRTLLPAPDDEIVDSIPHRVLEIVLVTAEAGAHAAGLEQIDDGAHAIGVAMLGTSAERRMMAERDSPPDTFAGGGEGPLHEVPVLGIFEQPPSSEKILFRRVEANELDVAADAEFVEQSRVDRGASCRFLAGQALREDRSCPSTCSRSSCSSVSRVS